MDVFINQLLHSFHLTSRTHCCLLVVIIFRRYKNCFSFPEIFLQNVCYNLIDFLLLYGHIFSLISNVNKMRKMVGERDRDIERTLYRYFPIILRTLLTRRGFNASQTNGYNEGNIGEIDKSVNKARKWSVNCYSINRSLTTANNEFYIWFLDFLPASMHFPHSNLLEPRRFRFSKFFLCTQS